MSKRNPSDIEDADLLQITKGLEQALAACKRMRNADAVVCAPLQLIACHASSVLLNKLNPKFDISTTPVPPLVCRVMSNLVVETWIEGAIRIQWIVHPEKEELVVYWCSQDRAFSAPHGQRQTWTHSTHISIVFMNVWMGSMNTVQGLRGRESTVNRIHEIIMEEKPGSIVFRYMAMKI